MTILLSFHRNCLRSSIFSRELLNFFLLELIGLFLLKLSLSGEGNGLVRAVALVSSGYGLWLLYAAGVEYLLLSLLLYGPGLLLFLYSRRQLGAEQRLSLRERLLAGITLVSLVPAIWSFAHV